MIEKMTPRKVNVMIAAAWFLALALLAAVLFGGSSQAADSWSKTDLAMAGTMLALKAVDFGQTRYIAQHPERFYELNPILGRHPSESEVALFFIGSAAVNLAVAHYLPSPWRKAWLASQIGLSLYWTTHNQQIGLKVAW